MNNDWKILAYIYSQLCCNPFSLSYCVDKYCKAQYEEAFLDLIERIKRIKVDPLIYIKTVCEAYKRQYKFTPHPTYLSSDKGMKLFHENHVVISKVDKKFIQELREQYKDKIKEVWGVRV